MTIDPPPVAAPAAAPSAPADRDPASAGRPALSLLWWTFLANAAVLVIAAVLLIVTPVTISAPIAIAELGILLAGLTTMLVANAVLLRRALLPLRRLAALMARIDPLRPGRRLDAPHGHPAEVAALADAFNTMLDRLEHERQDSTRRVLGAQESERLRIARELHDELGQALTATAMAAEGAADAPPAARAEALRATADAIRASLDDVRRIARELRPEALDDLGLANALMALCRRVSDQSGVDVHAHLADDLPATSEEVELVVYRVAQESLTNVVRHAAARRADLTLDASAERLTLVVLDDGQGLPHPLPETGTGIAGMRERAMLVGGRLSVRSPEAAGTEVHLEVPPRATRWPSR